MAKGIYVGVDSKARKVKKVYVGVPPLIDAATNDLSKWTILSSYGNLTNVAWQGKNGVIRVETIAINSGLRNFAYTKEQPISDHIYYAKFETWEAANNKGGFCVVVGGILRKSGLLADETWHTYSCRGTPATYSSVKLLELRSDENMAVGDVYYFNIVCYCDLTEMFGAGNEPTKEWCDSYLGIARKVKKGYIGVGGVARPFFSAEQKLEYYGKATDLSVARTGLAATSVGDYALFGGGQTSNAYSAVVDTYTSSLIKGTTTNLSAARGYLAATSIGNYALFGGGQINSYTYSAVVDTYTSSLAKGTTTNLSAARGYLVATNIGDYALFGGGYTGGDGSRIVDTYTSNLVKGTATNLNVYNSYLAATSIGNYALFGGGYNGKFLKYVDTYTSNLVKGTATELSDGRRDLAATSVGNYALFGGGQRNASAGVSAVVDTYTSSLVKGTATNLSFARSRLAATSVGDYALFGGGGTATRYDIVDTYTSSLVKGTATTLSAARNDLSSTNIGDYALFGGGYTGGMSANVDVYQVV